MKWPFECLWIKWGMGDLLDWSSQRCRTIIQHYLKQRKFMRFDDIWIKRVYHTEMSDLLHSAGTGSCKKQLRQNRNDTGWPNDIEYMIRKQVRDVVHIANVSADDLSEFYPPLSSTLLIMSKQGRVRKMPSDTFCTEIFLQ